MGRQEGEVGSAAIELLAHLLAFVIELVFTFLTHLG
jgi:hypothetical protein